MSLGEPKPGPNTGMIAAKRYINGVKFPNSDYIDESIVIKGGK